MITVDFETHGIEGTTPPEPVGVAILNAKGKSRYYAWGHPTKNNCTKDDARRVLRDVWLGREDLLFQNAKFDLRVAAYHFDLPYPSWVRVHDTMFLNFLLDPHSTSSLKETAERVLGLKPDERDAIKEWLIAQGIVPKKPSKENVGKNIWRTPGDLCGEYAIGDVVRTMALYKHQLPLVRKAGMLGAYDRERRLLPILIENEDQGIRLDVPRLEKDLPTFEKAVQTADTWLRKRLKAPGMNVDSAEEVAAALKKQGIVKRFVKTKTGKDSISKKNLTFDMYEDHDVATVLQYRGKLETLLSNSMRPWLEQATKAGGYITTEWNQVKAMDHGTRSGRLSCSRFQNIAKSFEDVEHPKIIKLPPLPLVRRYLLPDEGEVFIHRDYNQQEFRILAHFAGGEISEAYEANPRLDYHVKMQELIWEVAHMKLERRPTKILNFGINYGMGLAKLVAALGLNVKYHCKIGCDHSNCKAREEAKKLRMAQRRAVPGVGVLNDALKERAARKEPIFTWGGRRYFCEPPLRKGDQIIQTYEYKMLNYLIQGSAADCTKEALVRYHAHPKKRARLLVTVHDEINVSAPRAGAQEQDEVLREVMESVEFEVPMLTDGKHGSNWGELHE